MTFRFRTLILLLVMLPAFGTAVSAQRETRSAEVPKTEDLPKNIRESLAKQRIEQEKKEHEELIKRTEEALRLTEELEKSFSVSGTVKTEDIKKLERLERLVKKIRNDLGGDDEDLENLKGEEKPSSLLGAFEELQKVALRLFDEVKKTTRHSISVAAIQSSNLILRVLRFIRIGR
jgi:NifB/MoaA-like Fe-S oxidoreductase